MFTNLLSSSWLFNLQRGFSDCIIFIVIFQLSHFFSSVVVQKILPLWPRVLDTNINFYSYKPVVCNKFLFLLYVFLCISERGVVWEETIILLPDNVHYVFLSATIPNAKQFAEWICHLHKQVGCCPGIIRVKFVTPPVCNLNR